MRQCACGGTIGEWEVDSGARWECRACGRRETFTHVYSQQLAQPSDSRSDDTRDTQAERLSSAGVSCFGASE